MRPDPFPIHPLDQPQEQATPPVVYQSEINEFAKARALALLFVIAWIAMCYA